MTKKDYILIADVLGNKIAQVDGWASLESKSLTLAYLEDFINMLKNDNNRFDKAKFINYINKNYSLNILF